MQDSVKVCAEWLCLGKKVAGCLEGSESAATICQMMYGDRVVTLARGTDMLNAISLTNSITGTSMRGLMSKTILDVTAAYHENATFTYPEPESCPICSLPFPADVKARVFRVCCDKELC